MYFNINWNDVLGFAFIAVALLLFVQYLRSDGVVYYEEQDEYNEEPQENTYATNLVNQLVNKFLIVWGCDAQSLNTMIKEIAPGVHLLVMTCENVIITMECHWDRFIRTSLQVKTDVSGRVLRYSKKFYVRNGVINIDSFTKTLAKWHTKVFNFYSEDSIVQEMFIEGAEIGCDEKISDEKIVSMLVQLVHDLPLAKRGAARKRDSINLIRLMAYLSRFHTEEVVNALKPDEEGEK